MAGTGTPEVLSGFGTGQPVIVVAPPSLDITLGDLRREIAGPNHLDGLFTGTAYSEDQSQQTYNLLVDSSPRGLQDSAYDSERFANATIYFAETQEEHHFDYDPYAGSVAPSRAFSIVPVSNQTKYEIHSHGRSVQQLHAAINWACDNARFYDTICLRGDLGLNWNEANGMTVEVDSKERLYTTGVPGSIAALDPVPVLSGKSWYFHITLERLHGGAFAFQFVNSATGALITAYNPNIGVALAGGSARRHLHTTVQIPEGCHQIQVQLVALAAESEAEWSDWGGRHPGRNIALPDWLVDPANQILNPGVQTLEYDLAGLSKVSAPYAPEGLTLPDPGAGRVYLSVSRPFPRLVNENDTIPAWAKNWIISGALYKTFEAMGKPGALDARGYAAEAAREHRNWIKKCTLHNPRSTYGLPVWSYK